MRNSSPCGFVKHVAPLPIEPTFAATERQTSMGKTADGQVLEHPTRQRVNVMSGKVGGSRIGTCPCSPPRDRSVTSGPGHICQSPAIIDGGSSAPRSAGQHSVASAPDWAEYDCWVVA